MCFFFYVFIFLKKKPDTWCTTLFPAGLQRRDQTGAAEGALAAQRLRGVEQGEERPGEERTAGPRRRRIREVRHKLKSAGGGGWGE